jgi:hypothetical protein
VFFDFFSPLPFFRERVIYFFSLYFSLQNTKKPSSRVGSAKAGVFAVLQDVSLFNRVYLSHGAVTWPGGVDLAPDAMRDEIKQHHEWLLKP